jgi:hypothetical protein
MNLIEEMAKREKLARIDARNSRDLHITGKDEWIKEFIAKELQSEGMQFEAVFESLVGNEKAIIKTYLAKDLTTIGYIVQCLIEKYMKAYAEKVWQEELESCEWARDE